METFVGVVFLILKITVGCVIAIIAAAALFFIVASCLYFLATHRGGVLPYKKFRNAETLNGLRERADEEFQSAARLWSRLPPGRWVEHYARLDPEERNEFLPMKTKYITFENYWKTIARSIYIFGQKFVGFFK